MMKPASGSYRIGRYVIDGRAREILRDGRRIPLSNTEFEVLHQIVAGKGRVILRDEFQGCAGRGYADRRHPVDTHVSQIKKKIGHPIIVPERGKGYRLSEAFQVEAISDPSLSELEKQLSIARAQLDNHTSPAFRGAITNCEELLRENKLPDAYVVLALAYINLSHVAFCRELPAIAMTKARAIIDDALREFPNLDSAHALRGLIALIYTYDWRRAENDLRTALKFNPQNVYGHSYMAHVYVGQGRFAEAIEHAQIAAELDYDSALRVGTEPWVMYFAGRTEEALILAERVVKRFGQSAPARSFLGNAYCIVGAIEKAIEEYRQALEIEFLPAVQASLGFAYAQNGRAKEAMKCLDLIYTAKKDHRIAYVSGYCEALVYAGLGSTDKALDALERAFEERCDWLIHLAVEPRWKALRNEKRFRGLLRKIGLPSTYSGPK